MAKPEIVSPNVENLVDSLRDIGYSFEVAVADLIDNSITAKANNIQIYTVAKPYMVFALLDNGIGMTEAELIEAMRLATKNPREKRAKNDLGRFGLGLKTASFSQCKKMTVISKKAGKVAARQWDLDYISQKNEWYLITPNKIEKTPLFEELTELKTGTLILWQDLDRCNKANYTNYIDRLIKHLSLVFHRFLEGIDSQKALKLSVNGNAVKPFNPFNINHPATQQTAVEKIKLYGSTIVIQPFILPHHSKLSQQEYELYATEEGYIKSQGFYLYRENRILIYGTWWGLHRALDAHKLVRIKIDIPNSMDVEWGIDIKKSIARPSEEIRNDLKRIIGQITEKGSRPYTGRGRKIEDKTLIQFWQILAVNEDFRFALNEDHPLYAELKKELPANALEKLDFYLKGVQSYLPIEAIQHRLQKNPHSLKQSTAISNTDIEAITEKLLSSGLSKQYIQELLKTEIYINQKHLLTHGNK